MELLISGTAIQRCATPAPPLTARLTAATRSAVTSSRLQSLQFARLLVCPMPLGRRAGRVWSGKDGWKGGKQSEGRRNKKRDMRPKPWSDSSSSTGSLTVWMEMIPSSPCWPLSSGTGITELTADWHPSHRMDGLPLRSLSGNECRRNPVVLNFAPLLISSFLPSQSSGLHFKFVFCGFLVLDQFFAVFRILCCCRV